MFYGWWDWRFLLLIVGSGLIDFWAGAAIQKFPNQKKLLLGISLFGNLGSLAIFKYSVFVATIFDDLLLHWGHTPYFVQHIPAFALILPVGISFYTFQSLSYTIDIYKNQLKPTPNILHFFAYLSMFPQLVAGPIIRAKDMLNQLNNYHIANSLQIWNSVKLIAFGLFQKTVIADNLSFFIDSAFEGKTIYAGGLYWWTVMLAFSFQIYCDFAGYTNIARGIAKLMGYHFRLNFNHPYLSRSLKEFWTRWHISLSSWFRDYVYIPLGGSRKGLVLGIVFIWITMITSGIWHGANYTFVIWGALHALFLTLERFTKWQKLKVFKLVPFLSILIVFIQVVFAWVFFRSDSLYQAFSILEEMTNFPKFNTSFLILYSNNIFFLLLAVIVEIGILIGWNSSSLTNNSKRFSLDVLWVSLALVLIVLFRGEGKQFIYFQF